MSAYRAPLPEISFLLNEVLDLSPLAEIPAFSQGEASTTTMLELACEAARLIENELAPLRVGSDAGCRFDDGAVHTPPGYRAFYARFTEAGWAGIGHRAEHGGAGLPFLFGRIVEEMLCSANVAFALYPALTSGCYEAIEACASDELKDRYLPRLATGQWCGTMCLTEPQAGTDLAGIRTRALPEPDGTYRIEGGKIFISSGEHDLSENIVHFVLARLPDAPPGIRGLSTFVVPKFLPDGERNAVRCVSLEHKMGLNGSATCTMAFEGARGWLAGAPNEGMRNMFVMMNLERIGVGVQGLGLCELATQSAVHYARERRQGRGSNGKVAQIIEHPDVRRMLLRMKATTEAARLMAYETSLNVDLARHHPDEATRIAAQDWVELTTPLVKSACTDAAFELASLAIQVHGGHGYIREQGIEQIARDAKILALYEGTNGIQAMDLVRRKLQLHGGRLPRRFFEAVQETLTESRGHVDEAFIARPLTEAIAALRHAAAAVQAAGTDEAIDAAFGCDDLLRAWTLTLFGWNWLRMHRAARGRGDGFAQAKRVTAEFFATRMLPQVALLCRNVEQSAAPMVQLEAELF